MGFGGISIAQLLIILFIVLLMFGHRRLMRTAGYLGRAMRKMLSEMGGDRRSRDDKDPEA